MGSSSPPGTPTFGRACAMATLWLLAATAIGIAACGGTGDDDAGATAARAAPATNAPTDP